MIFDNRRISEIEPQELINLVGVQEENLWIDFKQKDYHRDPNDLEKHKREICKDVTAMANAEGGYILIGVSEKNKIARSFFTVSDVTKVAQSIKSICQQYIDAPILNLEVEQYPHPLQWKDRNIELVIIHIPPSERKPHGFQWKGTTNFVKRDADATREYKVSELIQDLLVSYHPPIMSQIDGKLTSLLRNTQIERRNSISPQDDALEVKEIDDLLHLMKLRFHEVISDQPYYRIFTVPKELGQNAIDTRDENIRNILKSPPNIRRYTHRSTFGVTGMIDREIVPSPEGITSRNITGGEITLLKNGFFEVRCPLFHTIQFQWRREEFEFSEQWLYPYVVCEFPVSFLRLVKEVYDASGINASVTIQQEYHNLKGFMLVGGHPSSNVFAVSLDERRVYNYSRPIVSKRVADSNFIPDHVAYDLVRDVYEFFGFDKQWIPAFDENGNFIL